MAEDHSPELSHIESSTMAYTYTPLHIAVKAANAVRRKKLRLGSQIDPLVHGGEDKP